MMTIDTYVGPSSIEGVGIFAAQDIKQGDLVWEFNPVFDVLIPRDTLAAATDYFRAFVEKYGYPHHENPEILVIEVDNGRFMNHTNAPNTDFTGQTVAYALRDIKAGEEITCNYQEFEPAFELLPSRVAAFSEGKNA